LNILLLPRIGLLGAALATMVSYAGIVVFLAYQSLSVLPFKLDPLALLRYIAVGAAVAWVAARLPIGTPWLAVVSKGALILVFYTGILSLIDAHVRGLLMKIWTVATNWLHRPAAEHSIDALPAVSERT
jgi:O-antigen/teichoic acid export membrane protein